MSCFPASADKALANLRYAFATRLRPRAKRLTNVVFLYFTCPFPVLALESAEFNQFFALFPNAHIALLPPDKHLV